MLQSAFLADWQARIRREEGIQRIPFVTADPPNPIVGIRKGHEVAGAAPPGRSCLQRGRDIEKCSEKIEKEWRGARGKRARE